MTEEEKRRIKNVLYKWGSSRFMLEFEREESFRIKTILNDMTDISASVCSSTGKTSGKHSPVEDKIIRAYDLCQERLERINKRVEEMVKEENLVDSIISNMDYDQQFVLRGRYFERYTWDEMACRYPANMSTRNFFRIHKDALEEFKNRYFEVVNDKDSL